MNHHMACINMIKQQLRTGDVLNERILDLYRTIPREHFVPTGYEAFAYSDMQIPLPHGQCMMTPLEEATILQALQLQGEEVILEVGTGSGFLTALLAKLGKRVISVDYYDTFTKTAESKLQSCQITNVSYLTKDASLGLLEHAPYDVIVMTGGIDAVTDSLALQLFPGGKMVVIVGKPPVMQAQLHTVDHQGHWQQRLLFETNLLPLINPLKTEAFVF